MEAGADDIRAVEDDEGNTVYQILTPAEEFGTVRDNLTESPLSIDFEVSGLQMVPMTMTELDDDAFEANVALLERILAVDDVDAVYATFEQ